MCGASCPQNPKDGGETGFRNRFGSRKEPEQMVRKIFSFFVLFWCDVGLWVRFRCFRVQLRLRLLRARVARGGDGVLGALKQSSGLKVVHIWAEPHERVSAPRVHDCYRVACWGARASADGVAKRLSSWPITVSAAWVVHSHVEAAAAARSIGVRGRPS